MRYTDVEIKLPVEIWEQVMQILFKSSPKGFLSAAKVCDQWRYLAARICKKFCLSEVNRNILHGLATTESAHRKTKISGAKTENESLVRHSEDLWLNVYNLYQETLLKQTSDIFVLHNYENSLAHSVDPFLLLALYRMSESRTVEGTTLNIYSSLDFPPVEEVGEGSQCSVVSERLHKKYAVIDMNEDVYNAHILFLSSPVLLIRSREVQYLRAFILHQGCRLTQDHLIDVNPLISNNSHISTEGQQLLSLDDISDGSHVIYEANLVDYNNNKSQLVLTALYSFKTGYPVFMSKLLRGHVKTTSRNGYIELYKIPNFGRSHNRSYIRMKSLETDSSSTYINSKQSDDSAANSDEALETVKHFASSSFSKDLRYPNQTVFEQDWTLTSTSISRGLLYYWHMDRGREYSWLIGSTANISDSSDSGAVEAPSSYRLRNIVIGGDVDLEVTAVHFTRGLLLCGTARGHVVVYRLQEEASKNGYDLEFLRGAPWINVPLITKKVVNLTALWTSVGLIVAVLDAKKDSTISFLPLQIE